MIGTGMNAEAKISLERAKELKAEGKMVTYPATVRSAQAGKSLKNLKNAPVSQFHRLVLDKDANAAQKAPAKVTKQGDNIYGYLIYSDDSSVMPVGLYELESQGASLLWTGEAFQNISLKDDVLKGYVQESFFGSLLGVYYVELDFNTGEIINEVAQDLSTNTDYMQVGALDTDNDEIYGFGGFNGKLAFMKASTDDPTNYSLVSNLNSGESCLSFCYNAVEKAFYGVNLNYEFVKFDKDGTQTVVAELDVPDGANYITGLVYDELKKVYYWNINTEDELSFMATIDGSTYALDIYEALELGEEYVSLLTTDVKDDPMKPANPTALDADFYKESLIGFVNFQLPSTFKNGNDITAEEINYRTYVDGELYSAGTAKTGSVLKANFAVGQGLHVFGCEAVIKYKDEDGVEVEASSKMAKTSVYVGYDNPIAPSDVVLTNSDVTWTPYEYTNKGVNEGAHGGYVDPKSVYYVITLNGEVVEETLPGSDISTVSLGDRINPDEELTVYQAQVYAVANDLESAKVASNKVTEGSAFNLPFFITPTADEFALCTIVDNNEDGKGWSYSSGTAQTTYSAKGVEMDDWLFLPPFVIDDIQKIYSFSFEIQARSSLYPEEWAEVLICNEPSPRGVVGTIIDTFQPAYGFQKMDELFRVRQAGKYYIAVHCVSEGDQLGIACKNFAVEDNNITLDSPNTVEDLTAVAADKGALKATVSFKMPSESFGEQTLDADTEVSATIKVNGKEAATVTAKAGEEVSEEVETVQGENTIVVVTAIGELNGPSVETSVFTGVSVPATISSISAQESPDMLSVTITWPAVTEPDVAGGYVNPETVVYDIAMYTDYGWALYDEGITETSYTYSVEPGSEQDFIQLGVLSRNEAGCNNYLLAASAVLGTPLELPIEENFDDTYIHSNPWVTATLEGGSGAANWGLYYNDDKFENGVEGGVSMACSGLAGTITELRTPRFSTKGVDGVSFNVTVNDFAYLPQVTILALKSGDAEPEAIGEIALEDPDATTGLHTFTIELPAEYLDQDWVGLFIRLDFEDSTDVFIMEDLSITGTSGVKTVALSGVKIAGGKNVINVSGLSGQDVIVNTLDGRVAAKASKVSDNATFKLDKGVYVVKAGDKKAKVVVK